MNELAVDGLVYLVCMRLTMNGLVTRCRPVCAYFREHGCLLFSNGQPFTNIVTTQEC